MPEYADKQEDDQSRDDNRNPRSEPIRAERARHINATGIIGGLLAGVEYSAIVSTVEKVRLTQWSHGAG